MWDVLKHFVANPKKCQVLISLSLATFSKSFGEKWTNLLNSTRRFYCDFPLPPGLTGTIETLLTYHPSPRVHKQQATGSCRWLYTHSGTCDSGILVQGLVDNMLSLEPFLYNQVRSEVKRKQITDLFIKTKVIQLKYNFHTNIPRISLLHVGMFYLHFSFTLLAFCWIIQRTMNYVYWASSLLRSIFSPSKYVPVTLLKDLNEHSNMMNESCERFVTHDADGQLLGHVTGPITVQRKNSWSVHKDTQRTPKGTPLLD